jgi:hypothetical protein
MPNRLCNLSIKPKLCHPNQRTQPIQSNPDHPPVCNVSGTQHAGEMVFVPERYLHATVNLEPTVAAAVQCENADPRTNLSTLNSLIVHASEGARTLLG